MKKEKEASTWTRGHATSHAPATKQLRLTIPPRMPPALPRNDSEHAPGSGKVSGEAEIVKRLLAVDIVRLPEARRGIR